MRRISGCSLLAFRGRRHVLSVPQPVGSEHDGIMGCRPASRRRPGRRDHLGRPCRSHAARRTLRGSPWQFVPCSSRGARLPWCTQSLETRTEVLCFLYGSASRASRLHCHVGPAALVSASWLAHLASPGLRQAGSTCRTASRRWACCRTGGGRDVGGIGAPAAPGSHL